MRIHVLGAFGSRFKDKNMVSFLVDDKILVDAGNVLNPLGDKAFDIENILLTHHHLDHITEIPFLISESFPSRLKPLRIFASSHTIRAMKKFIMNHKIWPDFSALKLRKNGSFSLQYYEVKAGQILQIGEYVILPFKSNHIIPTLGFKITFRGKSVIFSGDTYVQQNIWKLANDDEQVKAIFIDVSYPARLHDLGEKAKHLSTDVFEEELKKLKRKVKIFVVHIKPTFYDEVKKEIDQIAEKLNLEISIPQEGEIISL
jgi:ribonuclease BN (tRNA processing enzyme)